MGIEFIEPDEATRTLWSRWWRSCRRPRAGVIAQLRVESLVHGGEALARHDGA